MTKAATILAEALRDAGCQRAFGMPGGEVLSILQALQEAGIAFTLAKHENAAGFMAEGVTQVTGRPAILLATLGPGVANAVNVIANAEQDRVPLVVITGCVDPLDQAGYSHQVFDHRRGPGPDHQGQPHPGVDGAVATTVAEKARAPNHRGAPRPGAHRPAHRPGRGRAEPPAARRCARRASSPPAPAPAPGWRPCSRLWPPPSAPS